MAGYLHSNPCTAQQFMARISARLLEVPRGAASGSLLHKVKSDEDDSWSYRLKKKTRFESGLEAVPTNVSHSVTHSYALCNHSTDGLGKFFVSYLSYIVLTASFS